MPELMPEDDPRVLGRFPCRHSGRREEWISECAQSDPDHVRPYVGVPKHCRPAIGAEMEPHLAPLRGISNVLAARPFGLDLAFPEHHGDAKWCARAALTRTTVTGGDGHRLAGGIGPQ
jgi:hypothetical protein